VKFGIIQEAEVEEGTTHAQRYRDLLEEVKFAEHMGFDFWGSSEQHFLDPVCTISAPETLYAWIAANTDRIRLRFMSVLLPFNFNHPLRVAERLSTLDIISNGRAEMSTARGNNLEQLSRFGVDPRHTREEWEESLEVIVKGLTQESWEHTGRRLHDIATSPHVTPRAVQLPHPPLSMIGTSLESSRIAGSKGIGLLTNDNWFGWKYLQDALDAYRAASAAPSAPIGPANNSTFGFAVIAAHCADTQEQVLEDAAEMAINFFKLNLEIYPELAKRSKDYAYLDDIRRLEAHAEDTQYIMDASPSTIIGDPAYWIGKLRTMKDMGVDEVVLRLDGVGHEKVMRAIELIGKYVIPEINAPQNVVHRVAKGDHIYK